MIQQLRFRRGRRPSRGIGCSWRGVVALVALTRLASAAVWRAAQYAPVKPDPLIAAARVSASVALIECIFPILVAIDPINASPKLAPASVLGIDARPANSLATSTISFVMAAIEAICVYSPLAGEYIPVYSCALPFKHKWLKLFGWIG